MKVSKKYLFIFLTIFLITFVSAGLFQKEKICGDGTIEGECSMHQPYFCSEQILVEKASICGCSNLTELEGDFCLSPYQINPKEIKLKYILRGEEEEINYVVYEGLANYLFNLSDFIIYSNGQEPSRIDFKLRNINEENQKILLIPLVVKIQNLADKKGNQARIAISLVQNIPFGGSDELILLGEGSTNYSRYPYEVLYDQEGICASKSELMVFLLREIGYETVFFYHKEENHDSVGIRCPKRYGLLNTSYCFVETTGPSIITDYENTYLEDIKLNTYPEVMNVSEGSSLRYMHEYRDANRLKKMRKGIEEKGKINLLRDFKLKKIMKRYGIE